MTLEGGQTQERVAKARISIGRRRIGPPAGTETGDHAVPVPSDQIAPAGSYSERRTQNLRVASPTDLVRPHQARGIGGFPEIGTKRGERAVWPRFSANLSAGACRLVVRPPSQSKSGLHGKRIEPRPGIERNPFDGPADLVITGEIDPFAIGADRRVGRAAQDVRHLSQRPRRPEFRIDFGGV